jgi:hypothetical protein
MDAEDQVKYAKRIVDRGMSLTAARRMILKARAKGGDVSAYSAGHRRTLARLESCVADASERIGVFLDMPGVEFNRMIEQTDAFTRRGLVKALGELARSVKDLEETIEERAPKLVRRSA